MADLSKFSDEQLRSALKKPDLSKFSDEQLKSKLSKDGGSFKAFAEKAENVPLLESVATKVSEGQTFGARPALVGLIGGALQGAGTFAGLEGQPLGFRAKKALEEAGKGFVGARREATQRQYQIAEERPTLSLASELAGSIASPVRIANPLAAGAAAGVGRAVGESETLGDAAIKIAIGTAAGKAGQRLGASASAFGRGLGRGFEEGGEGLASKAGQLAGSAVSGGKGFVRKVGSALTGVSEQDIKTFAKDAAKIEQIYKASGGSVSEAADVMREGITNNIQRAREKLSSEIGDALTGAQGKSVEAKPILDSLEKSKSLINTKVRPEHVGGIDELINTVKKTVDDSGRIGVSDLNDIKRLLQEHAASSYLSGGQIFVQAKPVAKAARAAGAVARKELNRAVPELAEPNFKLARLHDIEDKINKNLIAPGKTEAAFIAAGSGANQRNEKVLRELGKFTGQDIIGQARQLSAAKAFGSAPLLPVDTTGKSFTRLAVATALGGVLGGTPGVSMALLSSPAILKQSIKAGKIPEKIIRSITGVKGPITDEAVSAFVKTVTSPEVRDALVRLSAGPGGEILESLGGK